MQQITRIVSRHATRIARTVAVCCGTAVVAAPATSYAFKVETHVWIAQQVLNDVLDDGRITIVFTDPVGNRDSREFTVDPALVEALRRYPNEYRMGAIGPDGFPDLVGGQMTTHPGVSTGWQTDQWLRFVYDRAPRPALVTRTNWLGVTTTLLQNGQEAAFAFGYLIHAASDIFAHTYVNSYAGDIFNVTDGEIEVELRHIGLEAYIKKHNPAFLDRFGNNLGRAEGLVDIRSAAAFLRDTLILNPSVASQYRKQPATLHLAGMYDFWKTQGDILAEIDAVNAQIAGKITSLQSDIDSLSSKINALKNKEVCTFLGCFKVYPAYCILDPGTCALVISWQLTLNATRDSLNVALDTQAHLADRLRTPVQRWRNDVQEAVRQYILTSQDVVKAVMRSDLPDLGEQDKPPAKLSAWTCRWAPTFAMVPSDVTAIGCLPSQVLGEIKDGIHAFRVETADQLGFFGWFVDPMIKVDQLIDEQLDGGFFTRLAASVSGEGSLIVSLARLREQPETVADMAGNLDDEFSYDSSNKSLLRIPDVSSRVDGDMHVTDGHFDAEQFSAVRNALVLSKLVLLGAPELNRMVREAGVTNTIYGTALFLPTASFNILFDAVRSIDGNHQWQEVALPYPRRTGVDPGYWQERQYGYPFSTTMGMKGFRLWQDCEVRRDVFKQIFTGPIAPALSPLASMAVAGWESTTNPFPQSDHSVTPWKLRSTGTASILVCGTVLNPVPIGR